MSTHLDRAYAQMKAMKSSNLVDDSLDMHFKELNCNEETTAKQEEYYKLYPNSETKPCPELDNHTEDEVCSVCNNTNEVEVPIEYDYCTWVEPVPPVTEVDEEGNTIIVEPEVPGYYTPDACTPTYEQWLDGWTCPEYDTTDDIKEFKDTDDSYSKYKKALRASLVSAIVITTTAGNSFDGGEASQTRMSRAIIGLPDDTTIPWILADNTVIDATKEELSEALFLSGQAQSTIWHQF